MAFNVTDLGSLLPKPQGVPAPPKPEDNESFLWKTLDTLNRPYSAVMGGVTGALSDRVGVLEGMGKGLTGEENYSALDVAGQLGYDTSSQGVRNVALMADVVNPLDPLNYLTFGFNKAGRVGRGVAMASKTGEKAELLTRAGAAAAGKWSPVSFANMSLVPRSVAEAVAKPVDAIAQNADRFAKTNSVLKHFGGMRKFEEQNPEFVDVIRGLKSAADLDERTYTDGMTKIVDGLRKRGYDEDGIAAVMPKVFDLVESPATRLARIDTELAKMDDGSWTGPLLPWKGEKDIADEAASFAADQEKLRAVKAVDSDDPIAAAVTIDPADPAPQDFMMRRREKLLADKALAQTFREGVAPDILNVADELAEWRTTMQDKYSVLKEYDPAFEFPYEDYMPHVLPHNASRREKRIVEQAAEKERARRTELASQGFADDIIERKLAQEFRSERAAAGTVMTGAQMRGEIPAANKRKYDMTAKEAREARKAGADIPEWNEFAPAVLDTANMHATRWRLAHDAHKKLIDMGQTVDGDAYRALDATKKREYVPIDFKVPWIAPEKNPFRDKYMTREAYDLMRKELGAANFFTGRGGQSALMEMLHKARHWWVSWTLGPFPATHARNVVSDISQNFLGGLNPLSDLAKAPTGDSSYMTAMAIAARNSFVPLADENKDFAKAGISKLTQAISGRYGVDFTEDKLLDEMRKRRILGDTVLRDDLELAIQDSKLMKNARANRSALAKLGDFVTPNPDRNKAVQAGFKVGSKTQDFTRSAMFVHALKEGMQESEDIDTALTYAEMQVRKHLFDYGDLTGFERDVMRLVIPFYTFTSKNIPLQLGKAVTEPGRHAYINRGFQGAWAGPTEDNELNYEDLPDWMQNAVGIPIRKMKDKDGNDVWSVSTLRGWLPQTELNELADAMRGEKFLGFFAERMNPVFKEFFEQTMNYDSYLGRAIDEGQTVEMGGIDVPPRVAHLVRNFRLFNELDKMNPLGLWTEIWEKYGAKEGAGRPHRREAAGVDRGVRQLTGLNFYSVDAEKEATRRMTDSMRDISKKTSAARIAARLGQTRESEKLIEEVQKLQQEARAAQQRLNQVRRDKATKAAAKYRSDL